MPLRLVRNDITKTVTQAIVNTANLFVLVGPGCDSAVYHGAGYDRLLDYRKTNIGEVEEGKAFLTTGFALKAKYIIHAVCPPFIDGKHNEENLLRDCYRSSLQLVQGKQHHLHRLSSAFYRIFRLPKGGRTSHCRG